MYIPKKTREIVYKKYKGHCAYCGIKINYKAMQIDHIQPKNRKGSDNFNNLASSCISCNATKATYTTKEFKERLYGDVQRLYRDSSKYRILERFKLIQKTNKKIIFYFENLNNKQT